MKISFSLLLLTLLLFFTACAAPPSGTAQGGRVRPGLILVTPDQAARHGIALVPEREGSPQVTGPRDSASVLRSPGIKAYTISRYVDPTDPNLMHEAHVVYRRESSQSWRLDVPPTDQILVGPRLTDSAPAGDPYKSKELDALLLELRRSSRDHREAIEYILKAMEKISKEQAGVKQEAK